MNIFFPHPWISILHFIIDIYIIFWGGHFYFLSFLPYTILTLHKSFFQLSNLNTVKLYSNEFHFPSVSLEFFWVQFVKAQRCCKTVHVCVICFIFREASGLFSVSVQPRALKTGAIVSLSASALIETVLCSLTANSNSPLLLWV